MVWFAARKILRIRYTYERIVTNMIESLALEIARSLEQETLRKVRDLLAEVPPDTSLDPFPGLGPMPASVGRL